MSALADETGRLLAEHHPLRLVVLNACDTGRGSASDAFSSTAAALIRREIPAVVAMQFEITDSATIQFAQTCYQHVAKCRPVDDSVMRARRALRLAKKDTLEWGTPVLYLRAPDARIFDAPLAARPSPRPATHTRGGSDIADPRPPGTHRFVSTTTRTPCSVDLAPPPLRTAPRASNAWSVGWSAPSTKQYRPSKCWCSRTLRPACRSCWRPICPPKAYQALVALDLSAFRQGPVHYDRQRGGWRSELDE